MIEFLVSMSRIHWEGDDSVMGRARRRWQAANVEARRLIHEALTAGAMPEECQPRWRFCKERGMWPAL